LSRLRLPGLILGEWRRGGSAVGNDNRLTEAVASGTLEGSKDGEQSPSAT